MEVTHSEAERRELVDRYVRGDLSRDESQAFEDHVFACDACFAEVQVAERFRAGVRDAAGRGLLDMKPDEEQRARVWSWWRPARALPVAAALVLATLSGWLGFVLVPELRDQLAAERQARLASEQQAAAGRDDARREQAARIALEGRVAAVEPNVPVAIVQTVRDVAAPIRIAIPATARHVVLWIEAAPVSRFSSLRLAIGQPDAPPVQTIDGLTPNDQGALAVAVPAAPLEPGTYVARLFGVRNGTPALVAEYRLVVTRMKP